MTTEAVTVPGWPRPKGYANGVVCEGGRTVYVAGQIGWDASQRFVSDDFVAQFDQALANVVAIVEAAGGAASTGTRRILEVEPTKLHERTPLYIGSRDDVALAEKFLAEPE